jgi:small conductance mechanosensitive channel
MPEFTMLVLPESSVLEAQRSKHPVLIRGNGQARCGLRTDTHYQREFVILDRVLQVFILILFYFGIAWLVARFLPALIAPLVRSRAFLSRGRRISERRVTTLTRITGDLAIIFVYIVAAILSLSLFVDSTGLLTFLGLFSAAFGLGARPLVSDYISGLIFLFEDLYTIGEKVEVFGVEGTVEDITLRTTHLRSPSGELYVIPNGEIRNVRNFARGTFSLGTVQVDVKTSQLERAGDVLNKAVAEATKKIPELIATPEVISETGLIGTHTRFSIVAKAQYGKGAKVRRELLEYIHDALASEGIETDG